jgi:hypothetical protein
LTHAPDLRPLGQRLSRQGHCGRSAAGPIAPLGETPAIPNSLANDACPAIPATLA